MAAPQAGPLPEWAEGAGAREWLGAVRGWAESSSEASATATASELLLAFVCFNFTGPLTDAEVAARPAVAALVGLPQHCSRGARETLASDGEPAHRCVAHPALLAAALAVLERGGEGAAPEQLLWRCRALFVQQRVLVNLSNSLRGRILACLDRLDQVAPEGGGGLPPPCELQLVRGLVHYYYREPHLSCDALDRAKALSSMRVELTSMVGVRTLHQTFETAQLMVRAASGGPPVEPREGPPLPTPRVISGEGLGSNVLDRPRPISENVASGLVTEEQVRKEEAERAASVAKMAAMMQPVHVNPQAAEEPAGGPRSPVSDSPLSEAEQALLIGLCMNVSNKNPMHGLTNEEMLPYLERLMVEEHSSWLLRGQVLLLRSRLERNRARVQERSLLQLAELSEHFAVPHGLQEGDVRETETAHRADNFWRVLWPSIFELRRELTKCYMSAHMFKTALEIAEGIEAWPLVIRCCAQLGKKNKAEAVLRGLLEESPEDPWLWSSLGDATRPQLQADPTAPAHGNTQVSEESYLKAWELSGGQLTAAMRGLGELYLDLGRFQEAVDCFEHTVRLNPTYGVRWFKHGWALLKVENWERAAHCYTRTVQLEIDDGFAWSNLALCNIKLDRKVTAFHCLRQAKKYSAADWRIWDNLYTIAVEVGELQEAIRVLGEILDLAGRNYRVRADVLEQLVDKVAERVRGEAQPEPGRDANPCGAPADLPDEGEPSGIVPLCHEVGLSDIFRAAGECGPPPADGERLRRDAEARERLRQAMGRVLGRAVGLVTQDAALWACFARFHELTGCPLDAFDARIKELRCITKDKGWRQVRTSALDVLRRGALVARAALAVSPEVLAERKVQTTAPRQQAKMQLQPVLRLAQDDFSSTPEYAALAEAVKQLEAQ